MGWPHALLLLLAWQVCLATAEAQLVRATGHGDLTELYRDNLEADFRAYSSASYTIKDAAYMLQKFIDSKPKHLTVLLVKDNKAHAVAFSLPQLAFTAKRVQFMVEGLNNASSQGMQMQDTLLFVNTWDAPRCNKDKARPPCVVPVFSLIKQWDWKAGSGLQQDILVPFFSHFYGDIINHPWQDKVPKALMRAAAQNGMHRNCTRLWLLRLAQTPAGQRLLDVGVTNNLKTGLKVELANFVDINDHAKWKYLLSTDGFTASCRFGKVLQTNSVVLKERSQWIEYYYRSVKPDVHYYEFDKSNVLQVLETLEAADPSQLQKVANAAQEFGYKHLSTFAKALYFAKAIEMYNAKFMDVKRFMATLAQPHNQTVRTLLSAMEAFTSSPEV